MKINFGQYHSGTASSVFQFSRDYARELDHPIAGSDDVLLGLMTTSADGASSSSVSDLFFNTFGLSREDVRLAVVTGSAKRFEEKERDGMSVGVHKALRVARRQVIKRLRAHVELNGLIRRLDVLYGLVVVYDDTFRLVMNELELLHPDFEFNNLKDVVLNRAKANKLVRN